MLPTPPAPPGSRISPWGRQCPLSRWQQPSPARRFLCAGAAPAAPADAGLSRSGLCHRGGTFRPALPPKTAFSCTQTTKPLNKTQILGSKYLAAAPRNFFSGLCGFGGVTLGSRGAPEEAADGSGGKNKHPPPSPHPSGLGSSEGLGKAALERLRHAGDRGDIGVPSPPRPQVLTVAAMSDRGDKRLINGTDRAPPGIAGFLWLPLNRHLLPGRVALERGFVTRNYRGARGAGGMGQVKTREYSGTNRAHRSLQRGEKKIKLNNLV